MNGTGGNPEEATKGYVKQRPELPESAFSFLVEKNLKT